MMHYCKTKIAILMATYNGEKFVTEQINSILSQNFKDWTLFIHDDGSTDKTRPIIKEYCDENKNIVFIEDNIRRGAKNSFLFLLNNVDAKYYMFCDQDDVWLPDKISKTYNQLNNIEDHNTRPILICSDCMLVDSNLKIIEKSMWESGKMKYKIKNPYFLEVTDFYTGCTMLFNRIVKELLSTIENFPPKYLHDQIIALTVYKYNGIIIHIDEPTILYRQHGNNVYGGTKIKHPFLYRIRNFKELLHKDYNRYLFSNKNFDTSIIRFIILRIKSLILKS